MPSSSAGERADGTVSQPESFPLGRLGGSWRGRMLNAGLALAGVVAIIVAIWQLITPAAELVVTDTRVGTTPVRVYQLPGGEPAPAVVIAHGFAGSRQLMEPFAITLARNGYLAVTFDFLGHGRNPAPMRGDITKETGATRALMAELGEVVAFARGLDGSDGQVALLGHSMACDILVRYAQSDPGVAATVAVSMLSPAVTPESPKNLLVIVGGWEAGLKTEALRVVGMVAEGEPVEGRLYGAFEDGSARQTTFAAGVEHIGVLYSPDSLHAALGWLNQVFDRPGDGPVVVRGPWLLLLFGGLIVLARPLSELLPTVAERPVGPEIPPRRLLGIALLPVVLTPLLLWPLEVRFLPVLVADYLALHFAVYGLLTALGLWWAGRNGGGGPLGHASLASLGLGAALVTLYGLLGPGLALDRFFTSFMPIPERWPVVLAILAGTLPYFLADESLTRSPGAPHGFYPLTKLGFLVSLALAIALNLERLFFLIIIVPLILVFFIVFGLFSRWAFRRTGHPWVGGLANAVVFAWAIGSTFPLVEG